jgi:hypothetical protein
MGEKAVKNMAQRLNFEPPDLITNRSNFENCGKKAKL